MGGSDGTRAVSEVMGAILVFSLLITALGAYQAVIVPNQNEQVEFRHNNDVQRDLIDLRNSIQRSATEGEDTSTSLDMGVNYPVRALTLNPPKQGGTLQGTTTGAIGGPTQDLAVENATAIDGEIDDYWDNSTREFTTGKVVYAPSYSIYRNAPRTVVENGLIYNKFDDAEDIPLSGQGVVSGREISLVAIESEISRSQVATTAVDVNAVSGTPTRIAVTNATSGDNVTIRIPTNLNESVWVSQLLANQLDGADSAVTTCDDADWTTAGDDHTDRYIHDCTYTTSGSSEFNVLALEMERNETYTLKLSKVSVGKTMTAPGPHYVVPVEGDDTSVPENGNEKIVLQVRDRFNNPVSGATVNLSVDSPFTPNDGELIIGGNSGDTFTNIRTDSEGRIIAKYKAPPSTSTSGTPIDIKASYDSSATRSPWDPDTRQNTTFDLRVINASKINRTQPLFNPATGVIVGDTELIGNDGGESQCGTGADKATCEVQITFNNTDSTTHFAEKGRFTFYNDDTISSAGLDVFEQVEVIESTSPPDSVVFPIQDNFKSATADDIEFTGSTTKTLSFKFQETDGSPPDENVEVGDWFVVEFVIDGNSRTYFVVVNN